MFDIGWTEMMTLAVLAIIVIGPKDLPRVLRTVGHWMGKARGMAREFQSSLDEIAREAELAEIKKGIDQASAEIEKAAAETEREIQESLDDAIDPTATDDDDAFARDLDDASLDDIEIEGPDDEAEGVPEEDRESTTPRSAPAVEATESADADGVYAGAPGDRRAS